eukprot:134499-Chlamydomonas_euryale.AAC.4
MRRRGKEEKGKGGEGKRRRGGKEQRGKRGEEKEERGKREEGKKRRGEKEERGKEKRGKEAKGKRREGGQAVRTWAALAAISMVTTPLQYAAAPNGASERAAAAECASATVAATPPIGQT